MGHPDFRVRRKIFATLSPNDAWGMVKLTADQQAIFIEADPEVFRPVDGAWGRRGCTYVCLEAATEPAVQRALLAAWCNTAPKGLLRTVDESS